jgi:5-methylcytosine-specific restriction endonuclease McrA
VLRAAILRRERRRCFYCRCRLVKGQIWFDHVVALAHGGYPEEANVVACCQACNRRKGIWPAAAFLRELYRRGRITKAQYRKRLVAVREIVRGGVRLQKAA